ncbi:MAG: TRAP transporter substrate-binding protein [Ruminiclostridium sp.]|nr:TRAP transporter substrate-binding protein [Ruminiclostridium sp.]
MKKNTVLTLALVLALVMLLVSCGKEDAVENPTGKTAGETEVFRLKIATTAPLTTHQYLNSVRFSEILKEVSGEKMTADVIGGGALGSSAQHYSQLKEGTLDMFPTGFDTATVLKGAEDFFVTTVPYVFDDLEHYRRFVDSDILKEILDKVEEPNGVKFVGLLGDMAPRQLTINKPVKTPADLKNVKMRTPESPAITAIWTAWGANPMQVPASEVYTALETKLCDGQDNDVIYSYNSSYYEVQKYDSELDYMQQALVVFLSQKTWDKMNDQQREWYMTALNMADKECSANLQKEYEETKQKAIDQGCVFVEFDKESFKIAAKEVAQKLDGTLFSKGLYDRIRDLAE